MWQLPQQDDTAADDSRNSRQQQQQQQQQHETEVVIRCNASGEQWRLRCRDNSWVGQLGNCSSSAASAKRESRPHAAVGTQAPLPSPGTTSRSQHTIWSSSERVQANGNVCIAQTGGCGPGV